MNLGSSTAGSVQKLKILIAEDEDASRHLMEASLTNWGHDAMVASDGEQAQAILQKGGIEVCILDWEMPRIDGVNLCRWIQQTLLTPRPYIILLTSRKEPGQIQVGLEAGANDYIVKPFNRRQLRERLSEIPTKIADAHTKETSQQVDRITLKGAVQ
jgi:DNA-binding response OmpR family regulator